MFRYALEKMHQWKDSEDRKPLILVGARRVGKTWLLQELARTRYAHFVYFDLEQQPDVAAIFKEGGGDAKRILELLSQRAGVKVVPGETLIVLDEISRCPEALDTLVRWGEEMPEYHVAAAGSMLVNSAVVEKYVSEGKAERLKVGPLSYGEFLRAMRTDLYEYYMSITKGKPVKDYMHRLLLNMFNIYLIVGGMPECVAPMAVRLDYDKAAVYQEELMQQFDSDINSCKGRASQERARATLKSMVQQLSKASEKFKYDEAWSGGRARDFQDAMNWLQSAGIVRRICNVSAPQAPLADVWIPGQFKLFLLDTGLLKWMAKVENEDILHMPDYKFKIPLTENYVLQQLADQLEHLPVFFASAKNGIDFLLQVGSEIIPVEVKSGEGQVSTVFKQYIRTRKPAHAICYSKLSYRRDGPSTNIPLYLVERTKDLL